MFMSALLDLLVLLLVSAFGVVVVRLILRSASSLEYLSLSFPVGVGIYTWMLFHLSWIGIPLNSFTQLLTLGLGLGTATVVLHFKQGLAKSEMRALERDPSRPPSRWFKRTTQGLLAVLLLLMISVSLARSYAEWDPLAIWSAKGYGIALEGTILAGQRWGWHGLAYPLNIPLMISTFKLVSGDLIPGSKLIFVAFFISTLAGVFHFWKQKQVGEKTAVLGLLLLATVPLFFKHGSAGYANFPLAGYIALGVIWELEGLFQKRVEAQWMGGLLLGLAGWTRAEGVVFAVASALGIVVIHSVLNRKIAPPWRLLAPIILIDGLWLVFAWGFFEGSQLGEALTSMLYLLPQGNIHLFAFRTIASDFLVNAFSLKLWGFLFPASLLFALLGVNRFSPRSNPNEFSFLVLVLLLSLVPVGLAYVASYQTDVTAFPTFMESFDRYFFPPALLIGILGIWMTEPEGETQPS